MLWLYTAALCLSYPLLRLAALFHRRLAENFRLRASWPDFSPAHGKCCVWLHASSAGEFEQARALGIELKRRRRDIFLAFSFFSDSAWHAKKDDPVPDMLFALPWDFPWTMRRLVRSLKPQTLIIAKYDAWPHQVLTTAASGVPVFMISASLSKNSLRRKFPLRRLLSRVYQAMQHIFAIDDHHAQRLRQLSPHNVSVAGDTRYDAIAYRLREKHPHSKTITKLRRMLAHHSVLVAGSTYPVCEAMIAEFLHHHPASFGCTLLAPHHVRPQRIASIIKLCQNLGLSVMRWSDVVRTPKLKKIAQVIVVDALGVLPYLYPLAKVAYVGGGFSGSVHSVIEPAIAGVPVITGPAIQNSAEAEELAANGLLLPLAEASAAQFAVARAKLLANPLLRRKLKAYFQQRLGASRKIVHTILDALNQK
ncbi:MAG: hypothetical protein N2Z22_10370 [Turneriella sp.]|nr:hypothetical protein [Turneriella sp.]